MNIVVLSPLLLNNSNSFSTSHDIHVFHARNLSNCIRIHTYHITQIPNNCIYKRTLIKQIKGQGQNMKPQANQQKKAPMMKGFGFGQAMFGIKDIMAQYGQMGGDATRPKIEETKLTNYGKPAAHKNTGIQIIKKQHIAVKKSQQSKPTSKTLQAPSHTQPPVFKLPSGKQFSSLATQPLIPIESAPNCFQLTLQGKLTPWQYNIFCDGIPAQTLVPAPEISFSFDVSQVRQGGLGNCYFIATLGSMAHMKGVLRDRVPKWKQYGGGGKCYEVNLFESGKNIRILVDNLFPKVFTKPVGNDISPMVLEKAYAQAYGNFQVTNMGHACDSMRDMTGAPTQYIDLKDQKFLIQKIESVFKDKFPIVIASKPVVKMDLSPKHSYNVVDYRVRNKEIFLKLRDPRGKNFAQFPQFVDITQFESQNGMFWVNHQILVQFFQVITICKAKQGNKYFYKTFKSKQLTNNEACIKLCLKQKAEFTFSSYQKHKKFFDDKHTYSMLRILVAKVETNNGKMVPLQTIASDFNTKNVCTVTAVLDPGEYVIFSKIGNSNYKPKIQNQVLTISAYTDISKANSLQFQSIKGHVPVQPFLSSYVDNNKNLFKQSSTEKHLYRYFGPLYGYICIYFDNRSGHTISQKLTYECQNVYPKENQLNLNVNENKIILHPIGQKNNCSHSFALKVKTIYK